MLVRGDKEGALKQFRYIYNYCIFFTYITVYLYTIHDCIHCIHIFFNIIMITNVSIYIYIYLHTVNIDIHKYPHVAI